MASNPIRAAQLQAPTADKSDTELAFSLYLLSEGYSSKKEFIKDCKALVDNLMLLSPFNLATKSCQLTVYRAYCPGAAGARVAVGTQPYQTGLSTAFGGYFQRQGTATRGVFSVDYAKVEQVCSQVEIWSATQGAYMPLVVLGNQPDDGYFQYMPGAIVLLTPDLGVDYPQLTADERLQIELEHVEQPTEPLFFTATSAIEGAERVLARALGLAWGLGDESEQVVGLPTVAKGNLLDRYPNLTYAPSPAEATFQVLTSKWQPFAARIPSAASPLLLHAKPDSPTSAALDETSGALMASPIGLWEGGGGYGNGVYRPTHDCLMRAKPGTGKLLLKRSQHPFCPVCEAYLRKAFTGEYSTTRLANTITLATQRSEFNKVSWGVTDKRDMHKHPTPAALATPFVLGPGDESVSGALYNRPRLSDLELLMPGAKHPQAFWGYTRHLEDTGDGFYLTDVRVHQSLYYDRDSVLTDADLDRLSGGYGIGWGDHRLDLKDFIRLHGSSGGYHTYPKKASLPADFRDVFSRISFQDLRVTFDDGDDVTATQFTFNIADYIRRKDYVFTQASHGKLVEDDLYQSGMQLKLVEERDGWPRLELELSVVLRTTAADFDPGAAADALKCYPQIQFRWLPRAGSTLRVRRFDGVVRMGCTAKHYMYMPNICAGNTFSHFIPGHHTSDPVKMNQLMLGEDPLAFANDASCFTDSNLSGTHATVVNVPDAVLGPSMGDMLKALFHLPHSSPLLRKGLELGAPALKPTWAALFDYYYPHAATATEPTKNFVGVYPHNAPIRQSSVRKLYVQHPVETEPGKPVVYDDIFISKLPRQGAYDNIHVNGYMGKHVGFAGQPSIDAQAVAQEDVVAAPFCGQDCFHLHWRWSLLSENTAWLNKNVLSHLNVGIGISPETFRGWDENQAHQVIGGSLIPPNQHLDVGLTYAGVGEKQVDYKVTVIQPAPGEQQVILEQGAGWAMTYSDPPGIWLAEAAVLFAPRIPHAFSSDTLFSMVDREGNFDKIYDFIRFHHSYTPASSNQSLFDWKDGAQRMKIHNHAQVPAGTDKPTMTWPGALDPFVQFYRRKGDAFKILQDKLGLSDHFKPYDLPQLVIDSATSPQLTNVSLEEL